MSPVRGGQARRPAVVAAVVAAFACALTACHGGSGKHARHASVAPTSSSIPFSVPSSTTPASSLPPTTAAPAAGNACTRGPDRTAAVNTFIAETRDGATLRFPAGICLRVDGTVNVVGRHGITIDGNGAMFVRTTAQSGAFSPQWLVQTSSGITLTGLDIVGPKPQGAGFDHDYEGQPGVAIDSSTNVTFEHGVVSNVWGDFFRISNRTDGVRITDNQLTEAGRQGLAVVGGSHITFDGNVVTRARRFAVDLEPYPSTPVRGVVITNNRFFDPSVGFVCATGYDNRCDRGSALSDVTVANNIQEG